MTEKNENVKLFSLKYGIILMEDTNILIVLMIRINTNSFLNSY